MTRHLIYILIVLLAIGSWCGEFRWSAKNTGMADCGYSVALDGASVFYNPAHAGAFSGGVLTFGYGLPLAGIESDAKSMYIAYSRPLGWEAGAALKCNYESIPGYKLLRLGGDFAYRFEIAGTLTVAAGIDWLQRNFDDIPIDDPIRAGGTTASGIAVNAGLLWQPNDKIGIGISAIDINEPKLALENDASATELPLRLGIGVSYRLINYFTPEIAVSWRSFVIGEKENPELRVGFFGGLPSGILKWRCGTTQHVFNIGAGWHTSSMFGGLDIDYALGLPLESSLLGAGETQHYFGISITGKQVRKRKGDLEIQQLQFSGEMNANKPVDITITIRNRGAITIESIPLSLAVNDGGKWKTIYPSQYVDLLEPGDTAVVQWTWKPKSEGIYTLNAAVDDDGSTVPLVSGHIDEKNENNNLISRNITISSADTLAINPEVSSLSATQVIVKVEEEPVVPVAFFQPGSAKLDSAAIVLADIFVNRFSQNPDAELHIFGYYDESDGDANPESLALARADAFRASILSYAPKLADRIFIDRSHDVRSTRISSRFSTGTTQITEENRRVEFSTSIKSFPDGVVTKELALELIERNPEFLLVILSERDESSTFAEGLGKSDSIRNLLIRRDSNLEKRIVAESKLSEESGIVYQVDPDGLIVRPRERYPIAEQWREPDPPTNVIRIDRKGFESATGWELSAKCLDCEFSHVIDIGIGEPPDSIVWDWTLGNRRYIAPNYQYQIFIKIDLPDSSREFVSQQEINVIPRQRVEAIENMLLVEFVFDESEPLSKYLERRLFNFAHEFVVRVDSGYSQKAEIQGHTDNIGTERRNLELSEQRAKREYNLMRDFIAYFADVSLENLDRWLAEHNCEISYKGYAFEKSYTLRGKLIGSNDTPYGRSINRRVTLEYTYEREWE